MRAPVRSSRCVVACLTVVAVVVVAVLASGAARAASASELRRLVLTGAYPDLRPDGAALRSVPAGADAVVVLHVRQEQWEKRGTTLVHNVRRFRRVKVLGESAAARLAHATLVLPARARAEEIKARSVTSDGAQLVPVDARVTVTAQGAAGQLVDITFSDVRRGSYLDVYVGTNEDERYFFHVEPFQYQEELPVLAAHLLFGPPDGLEWNPAAQGGAAPAPERIAMPNKREFRVFSFEDVPPLPAGAFLPPPATYARTLFIRPMTYSNQGDTGGSVNLGKLAGTNPLQGGGIASGTSLALEIGTDWATYARTNARLARSALASGANPVPDAAVAAAAGAATTREKVEAVRRALAGVHVQGEHGEELIRSPRDVQRFGRGHDWLVAQVHAEALRRAGLPADVLETRRRSDGPVPAAFPIPALLDQYVVRVKGLDGPIDYAPLHDLPAGTLPSELRGVLAMPLTEAATAPVTLPPLRLDENRVERRVTGSVEPDGRVVAETVATLAPAAAEALRARLRATPEVERAALLRAELRRGVPSAEVLEARCENVDDDAAPLVVTYRWEAPGLARVEGNELHLGAVFYDRWDAAPWVPETRDVDVDFGAPFETDDRVSLRLPPGVKKVYRVEEVRAEILGVGLFEAVDTTTVKKVAVSRRVRLDDARVPAAIYPGVRAFFADLARFDASATVARIGPAAPSGAAPEPAPGDDAASATAEPAPAPAEPGAGS